MARWEHSRILPWFCDKFGTGEENCLPYLPEEWKCRIDGKNEEIDILHAVNSKYGKAGTLNLLKRPGLKTWTIECFFAHPDKPEFATVEESDGWTPQFWVDFFESAMYEQKVLEMTVEGLDFICYVSVENFEHSKRAGEELDTYYTITLKEYQFVKIEKENVKIDVVIPPPPKVVDIPGGKIVKNDDSKYLFGPLIAGSRYYTQLGDAITYGGTFFHYEGKTVYFQWIPIKILEIGQSFGDVRLPQDIEKVAGQLQDWIYGNQSTEGPVNVDGVKNALVRILGETPLLKKKEYTEIVLSNFTEWWESKYHSEIGYKVLATDFFVTVLSKSDFDRVIFAGKNQHKELSKNVEEIIENGAYTKRLPFSLPELVSMNDVYKVEFLQECQLLLEKPIKSKQLLLPKDNGTGKFVAETYPKGFTGWADKNSIKNQKLGETTVSLQELN